MVQKQQEHTILGVYENKEVCLKKGKFGFYINHDGKNYSIKHIKKNPSQIILKDIEDVLSGKKINSNIILQIDDKFSIRKGKYGPYVFYKTETMKKPKFLKLKKTWEKYNKNELLNWIIEEYNI